MPYTYEYPRPGVTTDCLIITQGNNPQILLIQRGIEPYLGSWALPGGFVEIDEDLAAAASRELLEETGLVIADMKQFKTYGKPDRDPRGRTISVVFIGRISEKMTVRGMDDAQDAGWFPLNNLPFLAFDHKDIISDYIKEMQ